MTTSSVTKQKAVPATLHSLGVGIEKADSKTTDKSGHHTESQKFSAVFLNPLCEHEWFKLANNLQTLQAEGKTIWHCRTCEEITNTYDWQTP